MEQRLRSASSVDELMTLIYPSYWATLKCTSKLSSVAASSRSRSSGRQRPPGSPEDLAFSAVYLNLDVLKSTISSTLTGGDPVTLSGNKWHLTENGFTEALTEILKAFKPNLKQGDEPQISLAGLFLC